MTTEQQLNSEIDGIARSAHSLSGAVERIESLLTREFGAARLVLRDAQDGAAVRSPELTGLLDSREYPFRGLYTAPLNGSGDACAVLVVCFGTWGVPGDLLYRTTIHTAAQLQQLLRRRPNNEIG